MIAVSFRKAPVKHPLLINVLIRPPVLRMPRSMSIQVMAYNNSNRLHAAHLHQTNKCATKLQYRHFFRRFNLKCNGPTNEGRKRTGDGECIRQVHIQLLVLEGEKNCPHIRTCEQQTNKQDRDFQRVNRFCLHQAKVEFSGHCISRVKRRIQRQ